MKHDIHSIIENVRTQLLNEKERPSYSGDSYAANRDLENLMFFELGMKGIIPDEWEKYEKHLDPEFAEYERLKAKFAR